MVKSTPVDKYNRSFIVIQTSANCVNYLQEYLYITHIIHLAARQPTLIHSWDTIGKNRTIEERTKAFHLHLNEKEPMVAVKC